MSNAPAIRVLLRAGADVLAADNDGWTVLHYACAADPPEVIELLLKAGADPAAESRSGKTPRDVAAEYGQQETAILLERYGG